MGANGFGGEHKTVFKEIREHADCRKIFEDFWPDNFRENGASICPFHEDHEPSLQISKEFAYCHAEGRRYDAIDLFQSGAGVSKREAVSALASHQVSREDDAADGTDFGVEWNSLPSDWLSEDGQAYFSRRCVLQAIEDAWLEESVKARGKQLVVPIKFWKGDLVGMQYLREGEKLFAKGTAAAKGFFHLPGAGSLILCEGVIDAFSVETAIPGVNVCAILSASQVKKVSVFKSLPEPPILFFDNDDAGRNAVDKAAQLLDGRVSVVDWTAVPEGFTGKDVNDLLMAGHVKVITDMVRSAARWSSTVPKTVTATREGSCFDINNLETFRASRFLRGKPARIEWLLNDSLPKGSIGLLVGDGGIGKGHLLLQLGLATAAGIPFLDGHYEIGGHGKTFLVFGEDSDEVLHHRVQNAMFSLVPPGARSKFEESLTENLFIKSIQGEDARLNKVVSGGLEPTQTYFDLLKTLKAIPDLKLVTLDPVSRFFSGDENTSTHATFFCSLLERIAKETGAAVIISQHISKTAAKDAGLNGLYQGAARGSTGFTNAARWQLQLVTPSERDAKRHGLDPDSLNRQLGARVVKKNIGAPEGVFFLKRDHNGILHLLTTSPVGDEEERVISALIDKVAELGDGGQSDYTVRRFCDEFAGRWESFGKTRLNGAVRKAVEAGRLSLVEAKNKSGRPVEYLSVHVSEAEPGEENRPIASSTVQ